MSFDRLLYNNKSNIKNCILKTVPLPPYKTTDSEVQYFLVTHLEGQSARPTFQPLYGFSLPGLSMANKLTRSGNDKKSLAIFLADQRTHSPKGSVRRSRSSRIASACDNSKARTWTSRVLPLRDAIGSCMTTSLAFTSFVKPSKKPSAVHEMGSC
jgi:hypothetical protein